MKTRLDLRDVGCTVFQTFEDNEGGRVWMMLPTFRVLCSPHSTCDTIVPHFRGRPEMFCAVFSVLVARSTEQRMHVFVLQR